MFANIFRSIASIAVCSYLLFLASRGQLDHYIHPRYHLFTVIVALIGLGLLLLDAALQLRRPPRPAPRHARPSLISWMVIVVILLGYLLPPQPLSSRASTQRNEFVAAEEGTHCRHPQPPGERAMPFLHQWHLAFADCDQPGYFDGTTIDAIGFVQPAAAGQFRLTRYIISCCAVDSTPVHFLVHAPLPSREGTWVHIRGTLQHVDHANRRDYHITAPTITAIPAPEEPYEFLSI